MLREEWKFDYAAEELAEAARQKLRHHNERLEFWKSKKKSVMDTIRAEGLELDETITSALSNPKARDWHRSAQVMVRKDLQKDLEECLDKLEWHTARRDEYDGWHQVLCAQTDKRQAAEWIADADALFITAGAGMGVDSGLPDFRGPEGFWRAYPALKSAGLTALYGALVELGLIGAEGLKVAGIADGMCKTLEFGSHAPSAMAP